VLAKYIFLHEQQAAKSHTVGEMDLAKRAPTGSPNATSADATAAKAVSGERFVSQFAEFRDLYARSLKAKTLQNDDPQHELDRRMALDFIGRASSPVFGWLVLAMFNDRDTSPEAHRVWADASLRFVQIPAVSYPARYEAACSYARAGDWQRARQIFAQLYTQTLKRGVLPPIDQRFTQAFHNGDGDGPNQAKKIFRDASEFLVDRKSRSTIMSIACQCYRNGESQVAEELFARANAGLDGNQRVETVLGGVAYLAETKQYARADALLEPLFEDEQLGRMSILWRLGAGLAEKGGMTARSAVRLDRAMSIEYEQLSEEVNLESVRAEFGNLLNRYQQLADSIASLQSEPPQDIVSRVIRAADRWRSLDPDDTAACQAAARVLNRLGAIDAAWEYATTPFGDKPNDPPAWLNLGQILRSQGCVDLADRAYQLAFAAEPTNPQILWERAQMLEQTGKSDSARQCYRQIANGQWESQFQSIQAEARKAVQE
jgi:tetratricopeptide (TPR) repeat protein